MSWSMRKWQASLLDRIMGLLQFLLQGISIQSELLQLQIEGSMVLCSSREMANLHLLVHSMKITGTQYAQTSMDILML